MWSLSLLFQLVTSSDLLLDCQDGATFNLKIFFQEKYYQIHLGKFISFVKKKNCCERDYCFKPSP